MLPRRNPPKCVSTETTLTQGYADIRQSGGDSKHEWAPRGSCEGKGGTIGGAQDGETRQWGQGRQRRRGKEAERGLEGAHGTERPEDSRCRTHGPPYSSRRTRGHSRGRHGAGQGDQTHTARQPSSSAHTLTLTTPEPDQQQLRGVTESASVINYK